VSIKKTRLRLRLIQVIGIINTNFSKKKQKIKNFFANLPNFFHASYVIAQILQADKPVSKQSSKQFYPQNGLSRHMTGDPSVLSRDSRLL